MLCRVGDLCGNRAMQVGITLQDVTEEMNSSRNRNLLKQIHENYFLLGKLFPWHFFKNFHKNFINLPYIQVQTQPLLAQTEAGVVVTHDLMAGSFVGQFTGQVLVVTNTVQMVSIF